MTNRGQVRGAAAFNHWLKAYSNGISMEAGLKQLMAEQRQQGFQQGFNHALQHVSFFEWLRAHQFGRK